LTVAKRRRDGEDNIDLEIANAVEIAERLRAAALMLIGQGADLGDYDAFLEQGMLRHAWEELRDAASERSVPFAFWNEMSRAADLMGAPF
jgi:hypothetical protein